GLSSTKSTRKSNELVVEKGKGVDPPPDGVAKAERRASWWAGLLTNKRKRGRKAARAAGETRRGTSAIILSRGRSAKLPDSLTMSLTSASVRLTRAVSQE